ncbi:polyketide synthase [Lysobacter brunescens]|uniref:Polyketide synthase n=1 Tax=Lysobacter brunescens TaxID=262323 RepID=A0ABW2YGQ2_9GAMM
MSADKAIDLQFVAPHVLQIRMQDRVSKNTFSEAITEGLMDAFAEVERQPDCKVVILTGYDNYFASGGTQEQLLNLSDGRGAFTDRALYSLPLQCPVPVISAMQGHGIGGGFVLGLFADLVVLGRENIYTTNFMRYGFTPGMGATFILPQKLGIALASEMMLSANNYRGEELQQRGIPFPVVPRDQVMARAMELAQSLAEKPRVSLVALKDHLSAPLRQALPATIAQEVAMHAVTFAQPEVKSKIATLFGA